MEEGQIVKCVSSNFPLISGTDGDVKAGESPVDHPREGNYYQIGEILGDFLSFSHFNDGTIRWWHKSRFRLATLTELEGFGLLNMANAEGGSVLKPL